MPHIAEVVAVPFKDNKTRYVPLPPALWRWSGGDGRCNCGKCAGLAWWDTLAVPPEGERTWMVHFPELHGSPEVYKARSLEAQGPSVSQVYVTNETKKG